MPIAHCTVDSAVQSSAVQCSAVQFTAVPDCYFVCRDSTFPSLGGEAGGPCKAGAGETREDLLAQVGGMAGQAGKQTVIPS